jgi:hypothetical protein
MVAVLFVWIEAREPLKVPTAVCPPSVAIIYGQTDLSIQGFMRRFHENSDKQRVIH